MILEPFELQSKNPCLLIISSDAFAEKVVEHLNLFSDIPGSLCQYHFISSNSNPDDFLALFVPLLESKRVASVICTDSHFMEKCIQGIRYLNQPFIFNSISESEKDIKLFFNTSKTVPSFQDSKQVASLLRLDFTALQIHQLDGSLSEFIEQTHSRVLRLGQIKENLYASEIIIRDADFIHFNIDALKFSEAPAQRNVSQSGLHSEEACQLIRYAGISDKLKVAFLSGIEEEKDKEGITANVLAQMLWYFFSAHAQRKSDVQFNGKEWQEYHVSLDEYDHDIVLLKSEKSGRWWLKPDQSFSDLMAIHAYYPILYADYEAIASGEISENILKGLMWQEHLWNISPKEPGSIYD